jgi:hypothetical protein
MVGSIDLLYHVDKGRLLMQDAFPVVVRGYVVASNGQLLHHQSFQPFTLFYVVKPERIVEVARGFAIGSGIGCWCDCSCW